MWYNNCMTIKSYQNRKLFYLIAFLLVLLLSLCVKTIIKKGAIFGSREESSFTVNCSLSNTGLQDISIKNVSIYNSSLVFANTNSGIFISYDSGNTWNKFQHDFKESIIKIVSDKSSGTVYFFTINGVYVYDYSENTLDYAKFYIADDNSVFVILEVLMQPIQYNDWKFGSLPRISDNTESKETHTFLTAFLVIQKISRDGLTNGKWNNSGGLFDLWLYSWPLYEFTHFFENGIPLNPIDFDFEVSNFYGGSDNYFQKIIVKSKDEDYYLMSDRMVPELLEKEYDQMGLLLNSKLIDRQRAVIIPYGWKRLFTIENNLPTMSTIGRFDKQSDNYGKETEPRVIGLPSDIEIISMELNNTDDNEGHLILNTREHGLYRCNYYYDDK